MNSSRRTFLAKGAVAAALAGTSSLAAAADNDNGPSSYSSVQDKILDLFESINGQKGVKIWAPATDRQPEFLVKLNPRELLFCGSSFKTFVLCEALRQSDSPNIDKVLQNRELDLNETVWSPDSAMLNPPDLAGKVSERTALEAMIIHSDNTGADMILKYVGTDNVREFIKSAGLENTFVPNSTRQFFGYLAGAANWPTSM
jgi:beta-lactamase class A